MEARGFAAALALAAATPAQQTEEAYPDNYINEEDSGDSSDSPEPFQDEEDPQCLYETSTYGTMGDQPEKTWTDIHGHREHASQQRQQQPAQQTGQSMTAAARRLVSRERMRVGATPRSLALVLICMQGNLRDVRKATEKSMEKLSDENINDAINRSRRRCKKRCGDDLSTNNVRNLRNNFKNLALRDRWPLIRTMLLAWRVSEHEDSVASTSGAGGHTVRQERKIKFQVDGKAVCRVSTWNPDPTLTSHTAMLLPLRPHWKRQAC